MRSDDITRHASATNGAKQFNPNEHMTNLRGKDYLEVKWRLVWFRQDHPTATISTEIIEHDRPNLYAVVKATIVTDGAGSATGYSLTEPTSVAKDYIANAETSAIGRALAHLGYGTQFAPEMDQGDALADSPVQRRQPPAPQPAPQRPLQQAPPPEPVSMGGVDAVAPSTLPTGGRLGAKALAQWLARARSQFPDPGQVEQISLDLAGHVPENLTIVQAKEVMAAIEGSLLARDGEGRYYVADLPPDDDDDRRAAGE